jgi:hypothetical protein
MGPMAMSEYILDAESLRKLLYKVDGNVTKAAKKLAVDPQRLRAFVFAVPSLRATMSEIMEQKVDAAIDVVFDGLKDGASFQNRFYCAKEMLKSVPGRARGFGMERTSTTINLGPAAPQGAVEIKWLEDKTIEHETVRENLPPAPAPE